MTADEFRNLALQLPGAIEDSHMGHPDFRINSRIFATLGPKDDHAMVKLPVDEQQACIRDHPEVFRPINGAWGKKGATRVLLGPASVAVVNPAITAAWLTVSETSSPKRKR